MGRRRSFPRVGVRANLRVVPPPVKPPPAEAQILTAIAGITNSLTALAQNDQRLSAQERILTVNEWAGDLLRGERANAQEAAGSYQILLYAERERQVALHNAMVTARKAERVAEMARLTAELTALTAQLNASTPTRSEIQPYIAPVTSQEPSGHAGLYAGLAVAALAGGAAWLWYRSDTPSPKPRRTR